MESATHQQQGAEATEAAPDGDTKPEAATSFDVHRPVDPLEHHALRLPHHRLRLVPPVARLRRRQHPRPPLRREVHDLSGHRTRA